MGRLFPDEDTAERLLAEGEAKNPGPWAAHSRNVAQAARNIAGRCPGMDAGEAYVLGLLHDIGRRDGPNGLRHIPGGCRYCLSLGFPKAAQICLTHSFPGSQKIEEAQGEWDCTEEEYQWTARRLSQARYDEYDRLIQLCDALAPVSGFCLMEKRLVDVALRHGVNALTLQKWKALFGIKGEFESRMRLSVYDVLPGAVENTFSGAGPS